MLEQLGTFWLVYVLGESGSLLFAAKSWLPKTGVFTRKKKKSEHVAILFIYIYFFGDGVFNFLAA